VKIRQDISRYFAVHRYTKVMSSMLCYRSYLYTYTDKNVFWDYIIYNRSYVCTRYNILYSWR